jgi:hypothetical protein
LRIAALVAALIVRALGRVSLKAGLHPFSDHGAFEFGEDAYHLKHRLAGGGGKRGKTRGC